MCQLVERGRSVDSQVVGRAIPHAGAGSTLRTLLACLAILALSAMSSPARAGIIEEMTLAINPLSQQSVNAAKSTLGLDADQGQVATDLYTGYVAAMRKLSTDTRNQSRIVATNGRKVGDWVATQRAEARLAKALLNGSNALKSRYFEDLKTVLSSEQLAKFPAFERAQRREHMRHVQFMAGEGADVLDILQTLHIDVDSYEGLAEVVAEYELSVDRAIAERAASIALYMQALSAHDLEQSQLAVTWDWMPRIHARAKVVRDTNRRFARQACDLLSKADRERFSGEVDLRSYPQIFRSTVTAKKLTAAAGLNDLTETQRDRLNMLTNGYATEVEAANRAWASAMDRLQEEILGNFRTRMYTDAEAAASKLADAARDRRTQLEKQYADRLEQVLTKDQVERVGTARAEDQVRDIEWVGPRLDKAATRDWEDVAE